MLKKILIIIFKNLINLFKLFKFSSRYFKGILVMVYHFCFPTFLSLNIFTRNLVTLVIEYMLFFLPVNFLSRIICSDLQK